MTVNRKFNCLGAMIFQSCKPVIVAGVFKFLLALQLLLATPASIKWILLATRIVELASGRFPHWNGLTFSAFKYIYERVVNSTSVY